MHRSVSSDWSARTKHETIRLGIWTGFWVASMALATFGPEFLWTSTPLTIAAILSNFLIGVGVIVANMRHLQSLDEMMRRVQLEAMGIALGVGVIGGLSYSLLDTTNVIAADAEISYLCILISLTYLVSLYVSMRRYR